MYHDCSSSVRYERDLSVFTALLAERRARMSSPRGKHCQFAPLPSAASHMSFVFY